MEAVKKKAEPFISLENRKLTLTNSHLSIPKQGWISRRQFLIGLVISATAVWPIVWKAIAASFKLSNLRINPAEADANQPVTITVDVANNGYLEGTYTVTLDAFTPNGLEESIKQVELAGRSTMPVAFVITKNVAGTYNIAVGELTGNFAVKPPPPPVQPEQPGLTQRFSQLEPKAKQFKAVVKDDEVSYYEAYDEAGMLIGYAFIKSLQVEQIVPESDFCRFGDVLPPNLFEIVGVVDLDYKVKAISVTQLSTEIYDKRILEKQFLDQFIGLSVDESNLSPKGKVDAITGVTLSSEKITDAIRDKIQEIMSK